MVSGLGPLTGHYSKAVPTREPVKYVMFLDVLAFISGEHGPRSWSSCPGEAEEGAGLVLTAGPRCSSSTFYGGKRKK